MQNISDPFLSIVVPFPGTILWVICFCLGLAKDPQNYILLYCKIQIYSVLQDDDKDKAAIYEKAAICIRKRNCIELISTPFENQMKYNYSPVWMLFCWCCKGRERVFARVYNMKAALGELYYMYIVGREKMKLES